MINVNQITAQMARMPDAALQRYAQMNKSDPYIVSLALSESNRRKELRTGAQMNAPQQPKVVDQELQGMAQPMPENTGIGQLPAQNLQGMAAGGIVAFDEGGEVPRYQSQGLVQMPTATSPYAIPGFARSPDAALLGMPQTGSPDKTPFFQRLFSEAEEEGRKYKIGQAQARIAQGNGTKADYELVNASIIAATAPKQPAAPTAPTAPSVDKTGIAAAAKKDGAETDTELSPATKKGLSALVNAPAPGTAPATTRLPSSPTSLNREYEMFRSEGPVVDPFGKETQEMGEERIRGLQESEAMRKKQVEEAGLAGLKEEARLKAREEKLGKSENELGGLSLLKAGFAMMSGTSPHALANIGIGANVGLEDYVKGREKIDASRERLDDANARLEQMRRGELMMNQKEERANLKDINAARVTAKQEGIAGLRQAYNVSEAKAGKLFDAYQANTRAQAELDSAERRTATTAGASLAAAQMPYKFLEVLGGGDIEAGMRKKAAIEAGKFDVKKAYSDYLVALSKSEGSNARVEDFATFASRFAPLVTAGENANIRARPGG